MKRKFKKGNKAIWCRDGLNPKEEIEARRLKDKLIAMDKDTIEKIKKFIENDDLINLEKNLYKYNRPLFSAWMRITDMNRINIEELFK